MELKGRRVLITGAAQGLGAATARVAAREGAIVLVSDLQEAAGREIAAELGGESAFVAIDVTSEDSWREACAGVGGIDVLINNAGTVGRDPLADTSMASYERIVAVNQTGVFLGMRTVIPGMVAAGYGSIVNVASVAGFRVSENRSIYSATKHAVVAMTLAAALEYGRHGVRINVVCPGPMRTPMIAGSPPELIVKLGADTAMSRIGEPEEIAELISFVASERASFCTGAQFVADGGWSSGFAEESG